jgi:succinate dehydrogenase / fumarate reductase, iron-sulfur subunit
MSTGQITTEDGARTASGVTLHPSGAAGNGRRLLNFTLHVWRQRNANDKGGMVTYPVRDINPDMSFLEMLDVLNGELLEKGEEPIAFDSDCREGICGTCCLMINGKAHGPQRGVATCQTYMRQFHDGQEIYVEPWRARAFPVVRDLVVDRSAFDRIIQAGGYVSVNTGGAQDANCLPVPKPAAERAMDAAACIGCGACVAQCKNGSAMLFTAAKVSHLALLPQGQVEKAERVRRMVAQMDKEGFGNCTNYYECEAACPKEISVQFIARMNREYFAACLKK